MVGRVIFFRGEGWVGYANVSELWGCIVRDLVGCQLRVGRYTVYHDLLINEPPIPPADLSSPFVPPRIPFARSETTEQILSCSIEGKRWNSQFFPPLSKKMNGTEYVPFRSTKLEIKGNRNYSNVIAGFDKEKKELVSFSEVSNYGRGFNFITEENFSDT